MRFLHLQKCEDFIRNVCDRVAMGLLYLVLVTLLVDGDEELGDVCDELVALGLPESLHTDLQVLDQHFLKSRKMHVKLTLNVWLT